MTIKHWLSPKLKVKGMLQKDLAKRCGVCSQAITAYVTGRSDPSAVTIYRIAEAISESPEQRNQYIAELVTIIYNR